MSSYLGKLGLLVELERVSSLSHQVDDGYVLGQTLEGRMKAQTRNIRPRQWSVGLGAVTPQDLGKLFAFSAGEWGIGPFVWVPTDAPVTNLLTPAQASCDPSTISNPVDVFASGPMLLDDGSYAGRSFTNNDPAGGLFFGLSPIPVLPGVPVTGSAYLLGAGARAGVTFYRADGAHVAGSSAESSETGTYAVGKRLHITTIPPDGAAYCLIYGAGTVQGARPAVTWTDQLFDWADGAGCPKAVIHGLSRDVLLALRDPGYGRYANASATVSEVE